MPNIQVVVRCRGRNTREVNARSPVVIEIADTYSTTEPYITINQNNIATSSKTFKVDQVYGSQADQTLIFEKVALPLFDEFMSGFNVTILAYGQTSTGKTYTMCGSTDNSDNAGIIPRILTHLFHTLEDDYVVKCSFLELYNEELRDLLGDDVKLRMHESNKNVVVQNLHEEHVTRRQDGFRLLERGLLKRKTASTKLNDVSSRSHTIFTINLYRKQDGELFRVSKMNLVDLAGSENVYKSGAVNERAKEAGSINQSLLTLGRVINSLSQKNGGQPQKTQEQRLLDGILKSATPPTQAAQAAARLGFRKQESPTPIISSRQQHIPYRESKLTRLLQDSLGGNTKTTLIATISPAKVNLDETTSTLDYASKAKDIKNTAQTGLEMIFKNVLLKSLSQEISKLTYDLMASRNKNGVWLDKQNFTSLTEENELLKSNVKESELKCNTVQGKLIQSVERLRNQDLEILSLQEKVKLLTQQNDSLNKKLVQSEDSIKVKASQVAALTNQMTKINDKYTSTTTHLTNIIYENLTNSINSISSLIQHNGKFDEVLAFNPQSFKDRVQLTIDEIGSTDSLLNKHLTRFLYDYNQNLITLNELIDGLNETYREKFAEMREANEKLESYIKEEHLKNTEEVVEELVKSKIIGLDRINQSMKEQVENAIVTSQMEYKKFFETSAADVSSSLVRLQNIEILAEQNSWSACTSKLFGSIESNLETYDTTKLEDISSQLEDSLGDLKNSKANAISNLEDIVEEDVNKFEAKMMSIQERITQHDELYKSNLRKVSQDLNTLKEFDAKDAFQVSPLRAERSPRKRSVSPTKLPRFDNKENEGECKRRKFPNLQ